MYKGCRRPLTQGHRDSSMVGGGGGASRCRRRRDSALSQRFSDPVGCACRPGAKAANEKPARGEVEGEQSASRVLVTV
ncbi:unnamed protein product [Arctogadus glacialis]